MMDTRDAEHDFEIEVSENENRKDFSRTEREEVYTRYVQMKLQQSGPIGPRVHAVETEAAKLLGTSRTNMNREREILANRDLLDSADFADWDEGKLSTNKAFQKIKAAQKKAEQERDAARRELDAVQQDLASAWQAQEDAETEAVVLRRKIESMEKPEVIERIVEVVPEDYDSTKKRVADLKRDNDRLNREYQEMRQRKQEADRQLEQANELLGEKARTSGAQRDIEQFTASTNAFIRQHAGRALAFDQFDRVDDATQAEFRNAVANLFAFAQNLVQMTEM